MGIEIGTAALISAVIGTGAAVGSSVVSAKAAGKAGKQQTAANDKALEIEKENEARRREEFDRTEAANKLADDIEKRREQMRYDLERVDKLRGEAQSLAIRAEDEKRKEPYRAAGRGALDQLTNLAGITLRPSDPPPNYTQGWDASKLTPPTSSPTFDPGTAMPARDQQTMADLARVRAAGAR